MKETTYANSLIKQVDQLKQELKRGTNDELFQHLLRIVDKQAKEEIGIIEKAFDQEIFNKVFHLNSRLGEKNLTSEERKKFVNECVELILPHKFIKELNNVLTVQRVWDSYLEFYSNASKSNTFPTIFKRYRADTVVFKAFQESLFGKTNRLMFALENHGRVIKGHFKKLKDIAAERGGKQLFNFGVGIVGTLVAGPFGGIVGRKISGALTSDEEVIQASWAEVDKSWEEVLTVFQSLLNDLEKGYSAIYFTLYGVYIKRVNDDLNTFGYEITDINPDTYELEIGVQESEKEKVINWFTENVQVLEVAFDENKYTFGEHLLQKMQQYIKMNEPVGEVLIDGIKLKDQLLKIKYAYMIAVIEREYWEKKEYIEAVRQYGILLKKLSLQIEGVQGFGNIKVPSISTVVARMIFVCVNKNQKSGRRIFEDFFHYHTLDFENTSVSVQLAKVFEIYKGFTSRKQRIAIAVKKIDFVALSLVYESILRDCHVKEDPISKYLKRRSLIASSKLRLIFKASYSYKEMSMRYKVFKVRYVALFTMVFFLSANSVSFASSGKLLPGVDNGYFSYIENKKIDTNLDYFALKAAILRKDKERVLQMLAIGADANLILADRTTVLSRAITEEEPFSYIKQLLSYGADPNFENEASVNLLKYSLKENNLQVSRELLENGADPNRIIDNVPLVFYAIDSKNEELVKLMLQYKAEVYRGGNKGFDSLGYINAKEDNEEYYPIVLLLLKDYSNVAGYKVEGITMMNAVANNDLITLQSILDMNGNPNELIDGKTILFHAIDDGASFGIFDMLLAAGAKIDSHDKEGKNILSYLASHTQYSHPFYEYFLKKGLDPNSQDNTGKTPLHHAVKQGEQGILELLIEYGADVNAQEKEGLTPLLSAVRQENEDAISFLVKNGANPVIKDKNEVNALMLTLEKGNNKLIKILLPYSQLSKKEFTDMLEQAIENQEVALAELLLEMDTAPRIDEQDGQRYLLQSIADEDIDILKALLEYGINPNFVSEDFTSPIEYAQRKETDEYVDVLLAKGAQPNFAILKSLKGFWGLSSEDPIAAKIYQSGKDFILEEFIEGKSKKYVIDEDLNIKMEDEVTAINTSRDSYSANLPDSFQLTANYDQYSRIEKEEFTSLLEEQREIQKEIALEEKEKAAIRAKIKPLIGKWMSKEKGKEDAYITMDWAEGDTNSIDIDFRVFPYTHTNFYGEQEMKFEKDTVHFTEGIDKAVILNKNTIEYWVDDNHRIYKKIK
ncbi:ankyrin repeat domain-containing protein [Planococcus shixiaomingii]|uniref:ankyrin repeat domain-containing protein n=1 Tax=Planococcus shixiaomingii TaxID=3058393 RepID=UPI00262DF8E8|nr:ankyrin repeat domain-containing protein [Planococcus sp. N022]WKA53953.1 ankyrin repeat domain-containing protein [Planococcus sp. N022]